MKHVVKVMWKIYPIVDDILTIEVTYGKYGKCGKGDDVICCFMKLNGNSKTTRYLSQIGQGKLNATTIEAEDVPVPAKPVQIEHKIGFTA